MTETADVVLSHPYGEHEVNARLELPVAEARHLIDIGRARPATMPDARDLDLDPDTAVTARPK